MPSINTLVSAALALSMAANASDIISGGINNDNSKCPNNWVDVRNNNDERCCYGSLWTENNDTFCCVRDVAADFSNDLRSRDDSSNCYPFCSDSTRGFPSITAPSLPSCATKVPFSASDYSSLVSSASSSLANKSPTTNSAGQTTTTFATSATDSASSTSSETGSSEETSTNAAMPVMTGSVALGGVAMVGALLAL